MTDAPEDITARAERLLAGIDLGNESRFSGAVWWDGETNYMDGDTPNQQFADAAPDLVRGLLAEVARLRATVTDLLAMHRYTADVETLAHLEKAAAAYRRHGNREEAERAETFIDAVLRLLPVDDEGEDGK